MPVANVETREVQILGKYSFDENFSAFAGLKHVSASGNLNLSGTALSMAQDTGFGNIIGVAYERKDIALRVALSYETAIDLALATSVTANGFGLGDTAAGIGDAFQLEFQSGVAQDTLVFGKIRRSNWENNQVTLPTNVALGAASGSPTSRISLCANG